MEPPGGFLESGEKGCLFSGSWGGGGTGNYFGDLGSKLIILGI